MPRMGVAVTLVDGKGPRSLGGRDCGRTPCCSSAESPTNPTLELVDIAGVAAISKAHGATFVVDNVFATPLYQHPLALGADVVVYSATKHIDGQGRCLGGVVLVVAANGSTGRWFDYFRHTGPSLSPFNAWVLLKGLETLPLRVERQSATAALLADRLADHPRVACGCAIRVATITRKLPSPAGR